MEDHEDLVRRAMANVTNHRRVDRPLWAIVADMFGVGSTRASELCDQYGYDPVAEIKPRGRADGQGKRKDAK